MNTENAEHPKTHNNPPASEALSDSAEQLAATCNAWHNQVPAIENEDQAAKATDFMERVRAELKEADAARKEEKRPHIDANAAIEATYRPIKATLETIQGIIKPKLNAWLQKKARIKAEADAKAEAEALEKIRIADEKQKALDAAATSTEAVDIVSATIQADEAKKDADAAVKASDAQSKETVGVKGNYSTKKTSLRTIHSAKVVDYELLVEHFKFHPKIESTLQMLANEWARSPEQRKQPLPGVELVKTESL